MSQRKKRPLPPANRVPQNTGGLPCFPVREYHVGSWGPLPDGKGPSTEVHVSLLCEGIPGPMVMRFRSAAALDEYVDAILRHRADVWPGHNRD